MSSIRLRLESRELPGAAARIRAEYGVDARVVSVDEARVGGVYGFFARRVYDVMIQLPDEPGVFAATFDAARREFGAEGFAAAAPSSSSGDASSAGSASLPGLEGLLARADHAEAALPVPVGGGSPAVSTQSDRFSDVLGSITTAMGTLGTVAPADPGLFRPAPGTLLAICGLREDALTVARSLADGLPGARLAVGGTLIGSVAAGAALDIVDDRRSANAARARGVELGGVSIVAIGLGEGGPRSEAGAVRVPALGADLVWVAVDATRKTEDTHRWVTALRAVAPVREMAVLGARHTESPESVRDLGLREAWSDSVR